MPTYTFKNTITDETFESFMTMSERETFLADNPHISQSLSAPAIGDSVRLGVKKIDRSFNDLLIKAKGAHRGSTINTL